jgi:diguanylate cyclase (GGDEF)-like protein
MLVHLRKAVLLTTSVTAILVLGVVAAWGHLTTASRVEQTQQADRLRLEETLAGLTQQYLQLAFRDVARAAASTTWTLAPDDAGDRAALERVVRGAQRVSYGAALVSLAGVPLTAYAPQGLPSPADPGYAPLRAALAGGKPGLSGLMHVQDLALVAFAVPVQRAGTPVGLLVAYADVRTWPLRGYDTIVRLGRSAVPYILDAQGSVVASRAAPEVGTRLAGLPPDVLSGRSGVVSVSRGGVRQVVSYAPVGVGWTTVTVQESEAFSGGLPSRSRRDAVALVMLLTLVVLLLVWFNHSRQVALRRLADERLHDPLTGLAQRRLFQLRLEAALARQRRTGAPVAVLYCDLDAFKDVNDTFGHNVGDQLLVLVAERMRDSVRAGDVVARLGGDEFAVLLEGAETGEVSVVAARLRASVEETVTIGAAVLHPRISLGAALLRDPSRAEDLLAEADHAMYRAKQGLGGEDVVVLDTLAAGRAALPGVVRQRSGDDVPSRERG